MKYQVTYHQAQESLDNPEIQVRLNQILEVIEDWVVPSYPGKSAKQKKIDLVHPILNAMAEVWLKTVDWETQGKLSLLTDGKEDENGTVDFFCRITDGRFIVVEVQFGNGGRRERDFSKITKLHRQGLLALGVLVYFDAKTAKTADSGLATYENVCKHKAELGNAPSVLIGVSREDSPLADLRELQDIIHPSILGGSGKETAALHDFIAHALVERKPLSEVRLPKNLMEVVANHAVEHSMKLAATILADVGRILTVQDPELRMRLLEPLAEVTRNTCALQNAVPDKTASKPRANKSKEATQPAVLKAEASVEESAVLPKTPESKTARTSPSTPLSEAAGGVITSSAPKPQVIRVTKAEIAAEEARRKALLSARPLVKPAANQQQYQLRGQNVRPFGASMAHALEKAFSKRAA